MVVVSGDGSTSGTPMQIVRHRLLDRLLSQDRRIVTVLSAPSGFGKTLLAQQFAEQCGMPVVWHRIEHWQQDAPELHRSALDFWSRKVPEVTSLHAKPVLSATAAAGELVSLLRTFVRTPVLYVIDDVHLLDSSLPATKWLKTMLERMPDRVQILLISQTIPSLSYVDLVQHENVKVLGADQLRFDIDETVELLQEGSKAERRERARMLVDRLQGWPAGIMLAVLKNQSVPETGDVEISDSGLALFRKLAHSLLDAQRPDFRRALLRASTLEHLTSESCRVVLDVDGPVFIERMRRANIFVDKSVGGVVFHRLFREFLQDAFRSEDPAAFQSLHSRAAAWYDTNNNSELACEHYAIAGDIDASAAIAERIAMPMFNQGRRFALLHIHDVLRDANMIVPQLSLASGMALMQMGELARAESLFGDAASNFRLTNDAAGVQKALVLQAQLALMADDPDRAFELASTLIDLPGVNAGVRMTAMTTAGVVHMRRGYYQDALDILQAALPLHEDLGDQFALSALLQNIGEAYSRMGRFLDASRMLQRVVALHEQIGNPLSLALARNNLGFHYHCLGNYEDAEAEFSRGREQVEFGPQDRHAQAYLYWSSGDLQRDLGCFDLAERYYENARVSCARGQLTALSALVALSQARMRLWQRQLPDAIQLVDEALAKLDPQQPEVDYLACQATAICIRMIAGEEGDPQHVMEIIEELHAHEALIRVAQVTAVYLQALVSVGDRSLARRVIENMLARTSVFQPLAATAAYDPMLYDFLLDLDNTDILQQIDLLFAAQPDPDNRSGDTTNNTYELRVYTLGADMVERDGVLLTDKQWVGRARDFFRHLLFEGPQRREVMSTIYWPEKSPEKVRSNFHTTINRIRAVAGRNVIAFDKDRDIYRIDPDVAINCDALQFRDWVKRALQLADTQVEKEHLLQRALALYQGDFLETVKEDFDWIRVERQHLIDLRRQALIAYVRCARARSDTRTVIERARRLLQVDNLCEEAYIEMMLAYGANSNHQGVERTWQEAVQAFDEELAVPPPDRVLATYQNLRKQASDNL